MSPDDLVVIAVIMGGVGVAVTALTRRIWLGISACFFMGFAELLAWILLWGGIP